MFHNTDISTTYQPSTTFRALLIRLLNFKKLNKMREIGYYWVFGNRCFPENKKLEHLLLGWSLFLE